MENFFFSHFDKMAETLFHRATLKGHSGWVTALVRRYSSNTLFTHV
jgi:hypothetical protein